MRSVSFSFPFYLSSRRIVYGGTTFLPLSRPLTEDAAPAGAVQHAGRDLTDEQTRNREAEEERIRQERAAESQSQTDLSAITDLLEDKFQKSDDFVHKENVKVYRNVQAVVVDEIKRCMESVQGERAELKKELADELKKELGRKLNSVLVFSVVSAAISTVSVVLWALLVTGVIR